MTSSQVEVITSVQRRRRWTAAEKERLVAASLEPGAVVSAIAREAGIHPSQLYGWRRQLCRPPHVAAAFAAVSVSGERTYGPATSTAAGMIEIEFSTGTRMRVTGGAGLSTASAVMAALAKIEWCR